ncbi:SmpA/OmlA family protein [Mesocricetibacter intestinalis]|uniref:SmpA/OmlA family protein n=1 Tax=Mesocricetibacter intestinalis TaxID=1521930 RepID=A0A4R6V9P3_9PAST|nr:OmpA family protein [Mesocricetibacter intestinalis]TDQ56152.1 SmpA/OmlA family protein [Mesocricetibacter intestinalis]
MKLTWSTFAIAAIFGLAACGNLSKVSPEGTAEVKDLVWPKIDSAGFNHSGTQEGSWPNWDNIRLIERGMNKDQLYNLIGRPHFAEGLYGVREWDYVFHYRENGEHKVCQYKVLFDKNYDAQSFFWYPNGCNGNAHYTLSGDSLFDFDKDQLTEEGRRIIADVANELKASKAQQVRVSGFTDRLGAEDYNLKLSQRRAETVRNLLQSHGVKAPISAVGLGKAQQIKACSNESGQALRDCLKPNRRVEIKADGVSVSNSTDAGKEGPSVLYDKSYPQAPKR